MELKTMQCKNCGANISFDPKLQVMKCEFCGSTYLVETQVKPTGADEKVIIFKVDEREANACFDNWVKKGLFKPGDLPRLLTKSPLQGMYIPSWHFLISTNTNWSGEKRTTRTVTERDSQGRAVNRTVEEWQYRNGNRNESYSLFIASSGGLANEEMDALAPFPVEEAVAFTQEYITGKQAEVPVKTVEQALAEAKQMVEAKEKKAVESEVDRITSFNLYYNSETHNLVYVPIWITGYKYKDKYYRVLINGSTKEVVGKKPVSVGRVLIAIGIVVAVIAVIGWAIYYFG
jgi:DNA-directed RNA polymerase subunit RPC12/RpoP